MKIRSCFVANSSSSSFIIAGKCFDDIDDVVSEFGRLNIKLEDLPNNEGYETLDEYIEETESYELTEILAEAIGQDYFVDSEGGYYYIGFDLAQSTIDKVIEKANKAKEVYGDNVEIHSGSVYN